jgi:hypothetical protein
MYEYVMYVFIFDVYMYVCNVFKGCTKIHPAPAMLCTPDEA